MRRYKNLYIARLSGENVSEISENVNKMTVKVPTKLFASNRIRTNYFRFELFKMKKPQHFQYRGFIKDFTDMNQIGYITVWILL